MGGPGSFVEVLLQCADQQANRDAYIFLSDQGRIATHFTYGELDAKARLHAQRLLLLCKPGDRVLIVFEPGLEYVTAYFACLYAGVIAVPSYPPSKNGGARAIGPLLKIMRDAEVSALFTSSRLGQMLCELASEASVTLPSILIGEEAKDLPFDTTWMPTLPAAHDLAFLQYTSGSTGDPKGVMVSHGNLIANSALIKERFGHDSQSVGAIWLPPYHDMGLIGGLLQVLYMGGMSVLMSPIGFIKSPILWLRMISKYRATTSGGPDFAYMHCVNSIDDSDLEDLDLSSWQVAFTGAEPIRKRTLEAFSRRFSACKFSERAFYPCYGLAESTLFVAGSACGSGVNEVELIACDLAENRAVDAVAGNSQVGGSDNKPNIGIIAVGNACQRDHAIRIVDVASCEAVSDDRIGEIWVRGPSVAQGYWNQDEASQRTFGARLMDGEGPFLRTGDLGFLRNGMLYVTGRIKDVILVRGRNHYATDIENSLRLGNSSLAQLGTMAIFARDEALILLCEGWPDLVPQVNNLFDAAAQILSKSHGLRLAELHIVSFLSLPKTSSGKLRRFACEQQYYNDELDMLASANFSPAGLSGTTAAAFGHVGENRKAENPATTNSQLREWIVRNLALRYQRAQYEIDTDAEFFQLGLDSISLVRLAADLEAHTGRSVDTAIFFNYPTINRLVDHLSGADDFSRRERQLSLKIKADVAIIGISCRFPGAPDKQAYGSLLAEGKHAIGRVPATRWDTNVHNDSTKPVSPWGGFGDGVDLFDAGFFGIAPTEAVHIDPQQRWLLELAFDALQDAGLSPKRLRGSRTGVFIGISSNDYALLHNDAANLGPYSGIGNAHSLAANRISYFFDFKGPSVAIDTACSSSLVALHQAVRSLQAGDCDFALVGGVNMMLSPHLQVIFSQAQMLAGDGLCKTFDDGADGYVRGEGAGFVVLQRSSDATVDGNRILAQVLGSAVNQDGRTNGLTAPSGVAQQAVICAALAEAGIHAADIDYIEAHGTGTKLGDPIELRALEEVFGQHARQQPLMVGSVKTNIGHLEAAAGIASVIKVVLALNADMLPKSLHFARLNEQFAKSGDPAWLQVCRSSMHWRKPAGRRMAGVSAFGFGGTNCHVILGDFIEIAPELSATPRATLLTLSAESPRALQRLMTSYDEHLNAIPPQQFAALTVSSNLSRADLGIRWAVAADNIETLRDSLRSAAQDEKQWRRGKRRPGKLLFCFSGQGAQRVGMGIRLAQLFPVFRNALGECEKILSRYWRDITLFDVLEGAHVPGEESPALQQTEYAQPAMFAFQYALVQLYLSLGVKPDAVIGHSLGEYTAACIAGVLTLDEAIELLVNRGRFMQRARQDGRMLVVSADEIKTRALLAEFTGALELAAINAATSMVVAGRAIEIERFAQRCAKQCVATHWLNTRQAFHSADLDPVLDEFEAMISHIRHAAPRIPVYGNLHGEALRSAEDFGASYWRQQTRNTVLYSKGLEAAIADEHRILLEIGPDSTLCALAALSPSVSIESVPSCRRPLNEQQSFSAALASLFNTGIDIDWHALHKGLTVPKLDLPRYPFERNRYWITDDVTPHKTIGDDDNLIGNPPCTMTSNSIAEQLRTMVAALIGLDVTHVDDDAPFVEMGADSLMLLTAVQSIEDKYGVKLSVTQLFDETPTIRTLAVKIASKSPMPEPLAGASLPALSTGKEALQLRAEELAMDGVDISSPEYLIARQINLMDKQIELLREFSATKLTQNAGDNGADRASSLRERNSTKPFAWGATENAHNNHGLPAWARQPVLISDTVSPVLKRYVEHTINAHVERTRRSKEYTNQYRPVLADNRASAGFRLSTKEAVYPIVGARAQGARTWDIDGNEFIDFTMGFGANLFGHSPQFITEELRLQIDEGIQLGPQSALAGVVANNISQLTGHERVAFCNSGSEAVMTAVRLARTVTRRSGIVIFAGSYHGTFDGVLARARTENGQLTSVPMAPGTPATFVEQQVMVLEYGSEESLALIKQNAISLAAVLVEPVQSRHPANQPVAFLQQLRELTETHDIAMIWDETITGFRVAPGGAQEYFGIHGDIATYGKIVGGGMPIGVVAGKSRFLDAIDGGSWQYGDDSYPRAEQTFFAGTFNKHPLTLRAANAVLQHLLKAGPQLQRDLNIRTSALAQELNAFFEAESIPIRVEHFSSLFRFAFAGNMDLLFMLLLHKGIYIWEGRNCFLSTAHGEQEIRLFIDRVQSCAMELRDQGFFASTQNGVRSKPGAIALSSSQKRFTDWAAQPANAAVSNVVFALKLRGNNIDPYLLEHAFNSVVARHEALRTSIDLASNTQHVMDAGYVKLRRADFSELSNAEQEAALREWKQREANEAFTLEKPPLMRIALAALNVDTYVLHLTVHHAICDGLSLAQILDEASRIWHGEKADTLPAPARLVELTCSPAENIRTEHVEYWRRQVASPPQLAAQKYIAGRSESAGARMSAELPAASLVALKQAARTLQCTPFMVLCAAYVSLLASQSHNSDILIGVPFVGYTPKLHSARVGCCVEMMPVRLETRNLDGIETTAKAIKAKLLEGYRHAPGAATLPQWTPVATFNFEPRALPADFGPFEAHYEETLPAHIEFDIMLNATETDKALRLDIDYRHRAMDAMEATQLLYRLIEIIETGCRETVLESAEAI